MFILDLKDPHHVAGSGYEVFSTDPDPDLTLCTSFKNVKTKNKLAKYNTIVFKVTCSIYNFPSGPFKCLSFKDKLKEKKFVFFFNVTAYMYLMEGDFVTG